MTRSTDRRGNPEWRSGLVSLRVSEHYGLHVAVVAIGRAGGVHIRCCKSFATRTAAINEGMRLFRLEGGR